MSEFSSIKLNEFIFEIRFEANPSLLDYLGRWTSELRDKVGLEHWRISPGKADVYDNIDIELAGERAYFTVKTAGFVKINCVNEKFFPNKSLQIMKFLLSKDEFGKKPLINRLGVRGRFANYYSNTFDELKNVLSDRYVSPTKSVVDIFGGSISDIAGPLDFDIGDGKIKSNTGPMLGQQLTDYFKHPLHLEIIDSTSSNVALYFDVDYYIVPKSKMDISEIKTYINRFGGEIWRVNEDVRNLLSG